MSTPAGSPAFRPETDTLVHAFSVIRRRWLVVVGAVVASLAVALAMHFLATPQYEGQSRVLFGAPTLSDAALQVERGTGDPEREAATQVLLVRSESVAQRVRAQLGTREPVSDLLSQVQVEAEENANVLRITATDPDPARATRLANAFADQYIAFRARSDTQSIQAAEADLRRQLEGLPADAVERRDLQESLQRLGALRAVATGDARIIGRAAGGEPASSGLAQTVVLAIVIGLAIGLTLAFLLESFDRRIKSVEDFEREYGLRALTLVSERAFKPRSAGERRDDLEPFRILRNALDFARVTRDLRSVLITSAVPGEGKTTVAVDLAHAMALTGRPVVLVELDLRRPTFTRHLDVDAERGVTTALVGHATVTELLQEPLADLPNFSVLPAGPLPPNPAELLESAALNDLLGELAREGVTLVLDAPPLIPVADSQVLLNQSAIDAALVVARTGVTTRDQARRARAIFERHLLQPIGLVVTGEAEAADYGYDAYRTRAGAGAGDGSVPRPPAVQRRA
jgi:receptor protein-tyrosine kinase